MMQIIIEENKYLERFFRNYSMYAEELKNQIHNNILTIINEKPYKIKTVGRLKYQDKTIYEYKVVLNKNFTCRVAYIKCEDCIIVFYMSTNIIKVNFTKEVFHLNGVL